MLPFYAARFLGLTDELKQFKERVVFVWQAGHISDDEVTWGQNLMALVRDDCRYLELRSSFKQTETIIDRWLSRRMTPAELASLVEQLEVRIREDLADNIFFRLPSNRYYLFNRVKMGGTDCPVPRSVGELFGPKVQENFATASSDLDEASKCLATGRYTACVFHLSRAMEVGLRALGKSLNDPKLDPSTNPSWERILQKCDAELAKPADKRDSIWLANGKFFADSTANLRAVKTAWRNDVMHVGHNYEEYEAKDIWNAVKAFMGQLATQLTD